MGENEQLSRGLSEAAGQIAQMLERVIAVRWRPLLLGMTLLSYSRTLARVVVVLLPKAQSPGRTLEPLVVTLKPCLAPSPVDRGRGNATIRTWAFSAVMMPEEA